MSSAHYPFHLALPVHDLALARHFYGKLLGCTEGRSAATWVDFDFFGHQLSLHCYAGYQPQHFSGKVDDVEVPLPHFGAVLDMPSWQALADRLNAAEVSFIIAPCVRFAGLPGEQATLFLLDPSGNALEFKGFVDPGKLFAG